MFSAEELAYLRSQPLARLATHTVPFEHAADGYAQVDAHEPRLIHMAFGYQ